uniref:Protein kinase domain-containing protein n=1 Tax=Oryza brachyantha TaxID=4533 RepID=J3N912_ORYBR
MEEVVVQHSQSPPTSLPPPHMENISVAVRSLATDAADRYDECGDWVGEWRVGRSGIDDPVNYRAITKRCVVLTHKFGGDLTSTALIKRLIYDRVLVTDFNPTVRPFLSLYDIMEFSETKIKTRDPAQGQDKARLRVNYDIKSFTEDNIKKITSNYSSPIGKGGFGEVFRGALDDEDGLVAVKRYINADLRDEFMEEGSIHAQISHKNVVKFLGFCIGENNLIMVTEFVSNGNLEDALHNSDISIPLDTRLGIAIGCAEALCYMHSMHLSSGNLICHGDIKPANILLDNSLTAKVSDFGISKSLSGGITRYTLNVKGSTDYMDSIYLRYSRLTPKCDVYSFEVVLLELLAREKILEGIANLATKCLTLDIKKRPQMTDVVQHLRAWMLRVKEGQDKTSFSIILNTLKKGYKQSTSIFSSSSMTNRKMQNFGILECKSSDARIFSKEDGTLEDNTLVAVKTFSATGKSVRDEIGTSTIILSQISHKYIIKLLGCCLDADLPVLIFDYATGGSLSDILYCKEDFPLDLRLKIAVKTSEALEYLHSCAIRHGNVRSHSILLDSNSMPKVAGFIFSRRLTKDEEQTSHIIGDLYWTDPVYFRTGLLTMKSDVYSFGIVLLELISRKKPYHDDDRSLIPECIKAYKADKSGKSIFDEGITAEEDISVLEEMGRLALQCVSLEIDERPTMKEVTARLKMISTSWKCGQAAWPYDISLADVVETGSWSQH